MSDSETKVKVTDKRMFTADGELREDFRHLDSASEPRSDPAPERAEADAAQPGESPSPPPEPAEATQPSPAGASATPEPSPRLDLSPESEPAMGAGRLPSDPSFFDLMGVLAEPIALFLGDARLPDGRPTEDLEMARFHIDLLEVVRQKTAGNLSAEESALLEDLLYRLRLRYVQKTG